ncbi:MAG: oxidoreductase [Thaumarchaeota archaeon]|nr:oxidoreductase [Nitrososphaerota archaeon]
MTGANSGLGYEVTKGLAAKGARVVMGCRSLEKGGSAVEHIQKEVPDASLTLMKLDLADLSAVRDFSSKCKKEYSSLDILCNNAGIMQAPRGQTADGFETHLGINHLGHFALTGLLIDGLLNTRGSRVVTVSSNAHKLGSVDFDNLGLSSRYSRTGAYARSKLANLLFTYELQRRLENSRLPTISVAAHPGLSATNLQTTGPKMGNGHFFVWMYKIVDRILAQSAQMGALPLLYAATAEDVRGGDYIGPDGLGGWRGYPKKTKSNKKSHDEESAKQLWDISTELTKVQYPILR